MMILKLSLIFSFLFLCVPLCPNVLFAQDTTISDGLIDEGELYAATKQLNQFFRRFNAEESPKGKRLYPKDKHFRRADLRKKYLPALFDMQNRMSSETKRDFLSHIVDKKKPVFLDFRGGEWFAQVETSFLFEGETKKLTLFMQLEKEKLGYKWVIFDVFFEPFGQLFQQKDSLAPKNDLPQKDSLPKDKKIRFLHPMSHEIGFMNLSKVFAQKETVRQFAHKTYRPDLLTLFFYELKRSTLKFEAVEDVKFHFFQVKGWYFELTNFVRSGYNSGWLISDLVKVPEKQKDILKTYICTQPD